MRGTQEQMKKRLHELIKKENRLKMEKEKDKTELKKV